MTYDAAVVGGSFAGLAAAMVLARASRSVCVIDDEQPRNRLAPSTHGVFALDGVAPRAMIDAARAQLRKYPTVRFLFDRAVAATGVEDRFVVELARGKPVIAARLVLSFGVSDDLPEVPGLKEGWGRDVLACSFCHGYEFAGRRVGVLFGGAGSLHQAAQIAGLGPTTLYLNGRPPLEEAESALLAARGVAITSARLSSLERQDDSIVRIQFSDGGHEPLDALYVTPASRLNSPIAAQLGCALDEGRFGPIIRADAAKLTTVPGVYAAGDVLQANNITLAVADGVVAGAGLLNSLIFAASAH